MPELLDKNNTFAGLAIDRISGEIFRWISRRTSSVLPTLTSAFFRTYNIRFHVIKASRGFLQLSVPMISIRLKGVAEAGYEDYRVEVEPQGSLLEVEPDSANPKQKKQRPATIGARSLKRTHDPLGH